MNGFLKQASFWIVLLIIVVMAISVFSDPRKKKGELYEEDFYTQLDKGNIEDIVVTHKGLESYDVNAKLKVEVEGNKEILFSTNTFSDDTKKNLRASGVTYTIKEDSGIIKGLLVNVVPFVVIIGVFWFFMFRHMQGGSNKAMSFGKSRARLASPGDKVVTFNDVAGVDEAKEELEEIIEFLKDPKKFTRLGGKIPKGVLLVGPPGSGKTLLARAVAGEAGVPFFSISGSDFVEMFVGVGASRVRDLFQQGQKHAPCIIFIDEIDAVGRQRGAGLGGGHDEREQTLNQLLVEMDGFNTNEGVILMAATNRPDVLDKALLRAGRFDRNIVVPNPDINGRESILQIHVRNNEVPTTEEVDLRILGKGTPGFSGADLANMVNEAALLAARRDQEKVGMQDFEDAKDRVLMGPERRSMVISAKEKKNTAFHEAGHVLVGRLVGEGDLMHKVTIIPRGQALGVTTMLPSEDRHSVSKTYCQALIRYIMGGRAAEEVIFNELSSGAGNDLKVATQRAHAMVCEWGMSDLGPISFGTSAEVFLGRDFSKERSFSEATAAAVDNEIHKILEVAYADAKDLIIKHKVILTAIAEELYERETLLAEEIDKIIRANGGEDLIPAAKVSSEDIEIRDEAEKAESADESVKNEEPEIGSIDSGDILPDTV